MKYQVDMVYEDGQEVSTEVTANSAQTAYWTALYGLAWEWASPLAKLGQAPMPVIEHPKRCKVIAL